MPENGENLHVRSYLHKNPFSRSIWLKKPNSSQTSSPTPESVFLESPFHRCTHSQSSNGQKRPIFTNISSISYLPSRHEKSFFTKTQFVHTNLYFFTNIYFHTRYYSFIKKNLKLISTLFISVLRRQWWRKK